MKKSYIALVEPGVEPSLLIESLKATLYSVDRQESLTFWNNLTKVLEHININASVTGYMKYQRHTYVHTYIHTYIHAYIHYDLYIVDFIKGMYMDVLNRSK
jgi:hypothetical protein